MPKADDPFYNRKPVPDEFIKDIGVTGLSPQEEYAIRERKYSLPDGSDARKFSNKLKPATDPYYARKPVAEPEIDGVGDTGLTAEEEFLNRERKFSLKDGSDARRFSNALKPQQDPYYGRKPVAEKEIVGVGETGQTPAEQFEVRERKQSLFQLSSDPFQILSGSGHRQSISGADVAVAASRRRSSAVAPHAAAAAANHHSGYDGDDKLAPIASKTEAPANGESAAAGTTEHPGHTPTYYDHATVDQDSVAPHESAP